MASDLSGYVRVPWTAGELQLGDAVLLDGRAEPWLVHRLDAQRWGRTPAVVSRAPNPEYAGPHFEAARPFDGVTLLVRADEIPTPRPHRMEIVAHDPVRRGWYLDPRGYDVSCGCGWRADAVVDGPRGLARDVWLRHKAAALTTLLTPDPRSGRPGAVLVRVPAVARWYVQHRYRLLRIPGAAASEGGEVR